MKKIQLTKGHVAIVDDIDYDYLMQWHWYCTRGYAASDTRSFDRTRGRIIYMHVEIAKRMSLQGVADHIDGDGLNNRRRNLRSASKSQNAANSRLSRNNTSGYKGVTWDKRRKRWRAYIKLHYRQIPLGRFINIVEAAEAYNEAALKYFGEFAYLNPIP